MSINEKYTQLVFFVFQKKKKTLIRNSKDFIVQDTYDPVYINILFFFFYIKNKLRIKKFFGKIDGDPAYCGVTQFEATDARKALPCWDEPSAKSTFTLELTAPSDLVCLSNMPGMIFFKYLFVCFNLVETKIFGSVKTVVFDKSPIMSTYLLAWFVGEFECVESKTNRNIMVRVWTQIGKKNSAIFACETACKCLDFYEKYFEIEYPLPKCDMIAVPDFAAGAMENWGLITYREIALLADKEKTSIRQLRYVAIVVCHELAHQWFGNLVTMDWWSQLWLNEGFACFMEYLSSAAVFPDWRVLFYFFILFLINDL
ncbi:hypothetical protein RFI_28915 [Reticulomyxa filosa]|uniref:Uncharacterized protein n=1 Tax=Reticulomyxa filosa TaxID=46433 RepID=X6M4T2_RETFI|nr:hypothetical protein RFI_28915 [Reticulomyxa filosa]|eukprot:ETO08472.1 hypothetical protein RFI_28915 [Reticulomyxa filosa]